MNDHFPATPKPASPRRLWLAIIPILLFVPLAIVFYIGLYGNPAELPSVLIGKPVPDFNLSPIQGSSIPGLSSQEFKQGQVTVVNVWSSWCGPCRVEHPYLEQLAQRPDIRFVSINTKDTAENALRYLNTLGQPYAAIGADESGRVAIDWGSYGAPETFIVDGQGIIRYKYIGPLNPEILQGSFAQQIEKAKTPAS